MEAKLIKVVLKFVSTDTAWKEDLGIAPLILKQCHQVRTQLSLSYRYSDFGVGFSQLLPQSLSDCCDGELGGAVKVELCIGEEKMTSHADRVFM